jgi:hypothetical protein
VSGLEAASKGDRSTTGKIPAPIGKYCPIRLLPWTDCEEKQRKIYESVCRYLQPAGEPIGAGILPVVERDGVWARSGLQRRSWQWWINSGKVVGRLRSLCCLSRFPSLIRGSDEWKQLSRLQSAFPQGGRAETAGRGTGETTEGTQPTDDFPGVYPPLPRSPLECFHSSLPRIRDGKDGKLEGNVGGQTLPCHCQLSGISVDIVIGQLKPWDTPFPGFANGKSKVVHE